MYEQVFNLTSRPFTSTPYVKHYFPATAIDQSLQQCKRIIDRGAGPVVVIGDHGTGKTLLLAMLEENFKSQMRIVNLSMSVMRQRSDLLQNILFELQLDYRGRDEGEMRLDLINYLKTNEKGRAGILLLVDDAQKLSRETVEELQVLTNQIRDGQPLVHLVIAGSRGLEDRLADASLESFNQRIAGRCFLTCLGSQEVESYVVAHLSRAGGNPEELFDQDAYRAIREVSEGRPRYINQVCDHAMIFSATRGVMPITDSLVREAWYDIQQLPGSVAPAGSGAASNPTPIVSSDSSLDSSDGWTVLEFGELGESDLQEFDSGSTLPVEETAQEPAQEVVAAQEPVQEPIVEPGFNATPENEPEATDNQNSIPVEIDGSVTNAVASATASATPTVAAGAAILASAMAGFGVAVTTDSPSEEQPTEEPASEELTQGHETETEQVESEVQEPATVDEQVEATLPEPVQSEILEETQQDPVVEEPVAEEPVAEESAAVAEQSNVAADPFADDVFENEEVLTDAYSPFVAQQNQRSLDVTTEQLQNLTPQDTVAQQTSEDQETQEEPAAEVEESFPTFDTAMLPPEPVREPVKPQHEARDMEETRQENEMLGPESLSEEFRVNRHAGLLSEGSPGIETEPIEAQMGSGFVPINPNESLVSAETEVEPQEQDSPEEQPTMPQDVVNQEPQIAAAAPPAPLQDVSPTDFTVETEVPHLIDSAQIEQPVAEDETTPSPEIASITEPVIAEAEPEIAQVEPMVVQNEPVVAPAQPPESIPEPAVESPQVAMAAPPTDEDSTSSNFHEQALTPDDPEIRRQALEIIKSLGNEDDAVSHETAMASVAKPIQQETNAIEDTIQRSIQARDAAAEQAAQQVAPIVMPDIERIKQSLQQAQMAQNHPQVPPPQPVAEEEPMTPERRILDEIWEQSAMLPQQMEQPTIQYPVPTAVGQDDRDILDVDQQNNQPEVPEPVESTAEAMPAWSEQEPSQGEAARVDYQQLFDQLRNIQSPQE